MKKISFLMGLVVYLLVGNGFTQTFQNFLTRVNAAPDSLKMAIVDSFMNAVPGFPYVEQDTLAHFLFRGNASQMTVPGDANQWNASAFPMSRISGTNLWFHTRIFESDARLDYKFVMNGSVWILDPLNPYQVSGGFGPNSELRMSHYIPPPEIQYYAWYGHGTFRDTSFYSVNLGNTRTIRVYLPPFYQTSSDSFPVILFHDGLEYVTLALAHNVLDYLIYHQRIEPTIAVFVPPVDRNAEYAGALKPQFSAFIVNEVMAWVDSRYRTRRDPEYRATLGASNGGNIALWLGLNYPQVFGKIAAQSSNVEEVIANGFSSGPLLPLTFYLDIGSYDIAILIPRVNNLLQILNSRGYPYQYQLYHEGHSWGNWRAHIDNALELFFPGNALSLPGTEPAVKRFDISQNYPNPFNSTTLIPFRVSRPSRIRIQIYDIQGRLVRQLKEESINPGAYTVMWDGRNSEWIEVTSGIYLVVFQNEESKLVRKMILVR